MSAQQIDENGYILIENNPISRSGVFEYLGSSIGAPEPNKIYKVYRPDEELSNPETLESFKLIPLIDDHAMIGKSDMGYLPPEKKGVHGIVGETLEFRDGVLYANLKIFSETLSRLIKQGKKDLSLGYRCVYEKAKGIFAGQEYDYIQRSLRGNHIALVDQARCAVSVLDHSMTYDSLELSIAKAKDDAKMEEKEKTAEDALTLEGLSEKLNDMSKVVDALRGTLDAMEKEKSEDEEKEEAEDEKEDKSVDEDKEKGEDQAVKKAMDEVEKLRKKLEAMDDFKSIAKQIAQRDKLAADLSAFVGTFDATDKSLQEVAEYGVVKLKIPAPKGHELGAITGYLAAAKKPNVSAMDNANKPKSPVDDFINSKRK
jgi:hypothetical protein